MRHVDALIGRVRSKARHGLCLRLRLTIEGLTIVGAGLLGLLGLLELLVGIPRLLFVGQVPADCGRRVGGVGVIVVVECAVAVLLTVAVAVLSVLQ